MRNARLGEFVCNGVPVFIEEPTVDTPMKQGDQFTVSLGIRDQLMTMGLQDILHLKHLVCAAEARIRLRREQAVKSRNLTLDL